MIELDMMILFPAPECDEAWAP